MKILSKITNNKNLITTFIFVIIGIIYSIYIHSNICINNGFLSIKYQIFYWILAIALIAILGFIVYKILSKNIADEKGAIGSIFFKVAGTSVICVHPFPDFPI